MWPLGQVAAEQVFRVRALHVRSRVDHRVPLAARGRVGGAEHGHGVGVSLPVRDHLLERERDSAAPRARAEVNVGDVG